MAMTKTRTVVRLEVIPQDGDMKPVVNFYYQYAIDDPDDEELPIITQKSFSLHSVNKVINEETNTVEEHPVDLTGHDPLIVTVCNSVWAEDTPEAE